jgi:hypothetical protein
MNLTGTEVRVGMTATANVSSVNTVGSMTIGSPVAALVYQDAPNVAYSLRMDIAAGETLTLDMATGAVTTDADPYTPTMIVTGTLTDGTDPVVFPVLEYNSESGGKAYFADTDSDYFAQWDGSLAADGWALRKEVGASATWTSTADVATPNLVPTGEWNADTNPHAWKPVAPATGTPVVTASAIGASAYRISGATWDETDFEGEPLPTMAKAHCVYVKRIGGIGDLILTPSDGEAFQLRIDASLLTFDPNGNLLISSDLIGFSASDGDASLTIDIHAGT